MAMNLMFMLLCYFMHTSSFCQFLFNNAYDDDDDDMTILMCAQKLTDAA